LAESAEILLTQTSMSRQTQCLFRQWEDRTVMLSYNHRDATKSYCNRVAVFPVGRTEKCFEIDTSEFVWKWKFAFGRVKNLDMKFLLLRHA